MRYIPVGLLIILSVLVVAGCTCECGGNPKCSGLNDATTGEVDEVICTGTMFECENSDSYDGSMGNCTLVALSDGGDVCMPSNVAPATDTTNPQGDPAADPEDLPEDSGDYFHMCRSTRCQCQNK